MLNMRFVIRNRDHYFTTVAWATNDEVMIAWLNRHQNVSLLSFCNITAGICQTVYILEIILIIGAKLVLNKLIHRNTRLVSQKDGWTNIHLPNSPRTAATSLLFFLLTKVMLAISNISSFMTVTPNSPELFPPVDGK